MNYKKIFIKFVYLLFCLALLISCSEREDSLRIKYIEFEKQDGDCQTDKYQNCVQAAFRYPEISLTQNKTAEKKINSYILEQMMQPILKPSDAETIPKMLDEFITDYNTFIKETKVSQGWEVTRDIEVRYFNDDFISIVYAEYSFLGGAHPNNFIFYSNFSLNSGNQLKLSDILKENYLPELTKIAEEEFRKLKNFDQSKSLNEAGFWFENDLFKLNNNFAIDNENMTFYYNNYEITAYSFSSTKLEIPLSKISHLISDKGVLASVEK